MTVLRQASISSSVQQPCVGSLRYRATGGVPIPSRPLAGGWLVGAVFKSGSLTSYET